MNEKGCFGGIVLRRVVDKEIHTFIFKTDSKLIPKPKDMHEKTKWFDIKKELKRFISSEKEIF